jgi:hypothetical protein
METQKGDEHWNYYLHGKFMAKPKPCLPGNFVHLWDMNGMFKVHEVSLTGFVIHKSGRAYDYFMGSL